MRRIALVALLLVGLALGATGARAAGEATSVSDGRRTLTVSKARDINPAGETITVDGKGYDNTKGIYVAFCVVPPPNKAPGPCGGGQDRTGSSGESVWVSSNPPLYARGLTTPYGKGGTFHVDVHVQAQLNADTDCRKVVCAMTTRNDHTRSSDRSQDVFVPLHFVGGVTGTTAPQHTTTTMARRTAAGAVVTATTTPRALLTAPLATVSEDHRSVSGGGKTLTASQVDGLHRDSHVQVFGTGYDTTKGVYVSLCFINAQNAPGPCASGSAGQSAWISSHPPDYAKTLAKPYSTGGAFEVGLTLDPVIDAEHDCTKVACAMATRNDDTHAQDRSQDLLLPVSFRATKATTQVIARQDDTDSNSGTRVVLGLVALVLSAGVAVAMRKARS